jgi:hypothetical protein
MRFPASDRKNRNRDSSFVPIVVVIGIGTEFRKKFVNVRQRRCFAEISGFAIELREKFDLEKEVGTQIYLLFQLKLLNN